MTVLDPGHVRDAHQVVIRLPDDDPAQLVDTLHATLHPEAQAARPDFHQAARRDRILLLNGVLDVRSRDADGAKPHGIEPDVDLALLAADDPYLTHAGDAFDRGTHSLVGDLRDLAHRLVRPKSRGEYGLLVGVGLENDRLINASRQIGGHARNTIADLLRGDVDVLLEYELNEEE